MYKILLDNKQVAVMPDKINQETFLNMMKIYLFHEEFNSWKEFKIMESTKL